MPKLDPDTATRIRLIGTAERLFHAKGSRDAAMVELQRIAGGRVDLLASAAGHFLGSDSWASHECYRLLWEAGAEAEPELVEAAAERVRVNRGRAAYGSEGMGGPRASGAG